MPFHILTGAFVHESNTFKQGETTLQDFRDDVLDLGQSAIDRFGGVNDELAGFLDAGRAAGWRVTHSVSANATPGARVSAEVATDIWRLTAYVSNPFNDAGDTFAYGNPFSFSTEGVRQATPQRPRTVGVRLAAGF